MGVGRTFATVYGLKHVVMRNCFLSFLVLFSLVSSLSAQPVPAADVINRARATLGSNDSLDGIVTLRFAGRLEPADPQVPAATLLILARKPSSQRLEIRVDDMVETTILNGNRGCIIRSNLNAEASQMRELTEPELERVLYSTRQFFNFFRPDFKNGEEVTHQGMLTHRGVRCHALLYSYPNGLETTRYFSVEDDTLVSVISENGVEAVNLGSQLINGIKFPERIEYYEGERKLHTIVLAEVGVNEPKPAGIFNIPRPAEN